MLQSIYKNANSKVYCNSLFSVPFPHAKCVRQGCNLSPLPFSLFMNDLEGSLKSHSSGFCTLNNCMLQLLMFADDPVLLANTANGLQESINGLEEFCRN